MHLVNKLKLRDESGFAFIAALLAMLIMVSLGVLIFTLTTRDVRVTIKLMGEKKAFSAAEHGIHWLMQQYVPGAALANPVTACGGKAGFFQVSTDAYADSGTCFSFSQPVQPTSGGGSMIPLEGYSNTGSSSFGLTPSDSEVTGVNTRYMSQLSIAAELGYGPIGGASGPTY